MEAIPRPDGDLAQRVALAELEIQVERNKLPWNTKQINRESRESNKPKGIACLLKQAPPTAPSSGTGCSPDAAAHRLLELDVHQMRLRTVRPAAVLSS